MIIIGLGSNLPSQVGDSRQTILAAIEKLEESGIRITRRSRLWKTAPVPVSDQPWFYNAAITVETALGPGELLAQLHAIETFFGRQRRIVNEARTLDLDLLDYHGLIQGGPPVLPHPRLTERAFVLLPMEDIAPGWTDPATGRNLVTLLAAIPPEQLASFDKTAE